MARKLFINSTAYRELLGEKRLVVVDGGARGRVFHPFNQVDKDRLTVIRFEPDSTANLEVNDEQIIVNKALWNKEQTLKLNVAHVASTSSVYPANKPLLSRFNDNIGYPPRKAKLIVEIQADSIDNYLQASLIPNLDFIKLDIHGAEYEALQGAVQVLKQNVLGLFVESWIRPIHKGQKTHGAVNELLENLNFFLINQRVCSYWRRKHHAKHYSKYESIAYESVYMKNILDSDRSSINFTSAVKLIAIADLYQQIGFALQLNDYSLENELFSSEQHKQIEKTLINNNPAKSWLDYTRKALQFANRYIEWGQWNYD